MLAALHSLTTGALVWPQSGALSLRDLNLFLPSSIHLKHGECYKLTLQV